MDPRCCRYCCCAGPRERQRERDDEREGKNVGKKERGQKIQTRRCRWRVAYSPEPQKVQEKRQNKVLVEGATNEISQKRQERPTKPPIKRKREKEKNANKHARRPVPGKSERTRFTKQVNKVQGGRRRGQPKNRQGVHRLRPGPKATKMGQQTAGQAGSVLIRQPTLSTAISLVERFQVWAER